MANISLAGKALPTLVMVTGLWIWYGVHRHRDAKEALKTAKTISTKDIAAAQLLCRATRRGYDQVVERLLKRRVLPDARDKQGDTPLLTATQKGDRGLVRLLLSHGASVNAKSKTTGSTPLHRAVSTRRKDLVRLLLKHGANVQATTYTGRTPRDIALKTKQMEIVRLLRQHRSRSTSSTTQKSAVREAREETAAPAPDGPTDPHS